LLEGINVARREVNVTLLQCANNKMFIYKANIQNIIITKNLLKCFELVLGLKVNMNKSNLAELGIQSIILEKYLVVMNCNILSIPFVYLVIPTRGNHKKKIGMSCLKKKNKLSKWRGTGTRGEKNSVDKVGSTM